MVEGSLKVKVLEWVHCRKLFFQWFFCSCLQLKNVLNQLYYIQKSIES